MMQVRQKIKKYIIIPSFILVTLILSIDFADAKNGKWKPGIENNRKFPIDRTSQKDGRTPPGKTIEKHIDKTLQNDKRIPTGKLIQDGRKLHPDGEIENDRLTQYNERDTKTIPTDGIMPEDRRIRINRILENDRLNENELQRKIDSLTQNTNMQTDKTVQDGRRVLNVRMQNDRTRQNDLKVQNASRIIDESNQNMINASRTQNDKPYQPRIARQNSKNLFQKIDHSNKKEEKLDPYYLDFWDILMTQMGQIHETRPTGHTFLTTRACHIIATTYISALADYKRYYSLKYFYQDILEYEVGYLVSDIVFKYQKMLEIYDMATQYYFKHQEKSYALSPYVLYLYTNVLELGTTITHLCNMLNVIEDKYKFIPVNKTGFDDYDAKKSSKLVAAEAGHEASVAKRLALYEKQLRKVQRAARKERKKARNNKLNLDTVATTPDRRPRVRAWPLVYGWSIEEHLW